MSMRSINQEIALEWNRMEWNKSESKPQSAVQFLDICEPSLEDGSGISLKWTESVCLKSINYKDVLAVGLNDDEYVGFCLGFQTS